MATPVLNEDGTPYTTYVKLLCTVNIGKRGQEIYHQVKTQRRKKLPEMLRDATKKYELTDLESKLLVLQDMSNTLTMRQRLKILQDTL